MIVPFSKNSAAPQQQQDLPQLPQEYLLMAMGQAHAEGKFHVYDPSLAMGDKSPLGRPPTVQPNANPKFDDKGLERKPEDTTPSEETSA